MAKATTSAKQFNNVGHTEGVVAVDVANPPGSIKVAATDCGTPEYGDPLAEYDDNAPADGGEGQDEL